MNVAIILAGGSGERMGSKIPKQFIPILDKPIIVYTLERFDNHPEIDAIEIVCIESHVEYVKKLIKRYDIKKVKWIVQGGSTFQESVYNGVTNLAEKCKEDDIVMIHMSVAPFIDDDIITDSISVTKKNGNAISANPCLLCMGKKTAEGYSDEGVPRETLVGLNTPQSFRFGLIYDAYKRAEQDGFLRDIDPYTTSLMYELGERLYFSKGAQSNIKITTKEDLELFEGFVLLKSSKSHQRRYDL